MERLIALLDLAQEYATSVQVCIEQKERIKSWYYGEGRIQFMLELNKADLVKAKKKLAKVLDQINEIR